MTTPSIDNIINLTGSSIGEAGRELLRKAYLFADKIHAGRVRDSGEEYISHPLAVAHMLASMHLDVNTIAAGLLHSVLKETPPAKEEDLRQLFGEDVANLVKGTTKIINVQYSSKEAYQAENIRKLLLAMAVDIRVMLIRLADRMHDMQTLEHSVPDRRREIARETMDLYAPMANRFGIEWMKRELEDLAFQHLYPDEYGELSSKMEGSLGERMTYVDEIKTIIDTKLREAGLSKYQILGRPKHLYSIYKKLIAQKIPLEKVYDKVAFRLIVQSVSECYEALGVVHSIWQSIPHRFKDFISSPKANGYQSLHTSVVGLHGEFMEVQIRTKEMDEIAKEGIAAHWAYKEGTAISQKDAKVFRWLKHLIQGMQEVQDPSEFLDAVKGELVQEEIFVLTPNGQVKGLPFGATPLDFAYAIHTEVGHHCTGAKANNRIVPLKYQLQNGDLVEILTSPQQWPNRGWLALVKSSRAKSRIRSWLRQEEQEKSLNVGRELLERELRKHAVSLKKVIKTGHLREVLKRLSCNSLEDLMAKVGRGKITVTQILKVVRPPELTEQVAEREAGAEGDAVASSVSAPRRRAASGSIIQIDGIDDVLVNISRCCMPVPGDDVIGFITSGRGISVHKANCQNLQATDPERWIEVRWATDVNSAHRVKLVVEGTDQRRLLARLSDAIAVNNATIMSMEARTVKNSNTVMVTMIVEVEGRGHLDRLLQQIRNVEGVSAAGRK